MYKFTASIDSQSQFGRKKATRIARKGLGTAYANQTISLRAVQFVKPVDQSDLYDF